MKRRAIKYLEDFGESFWNEADERVREVTDKFVQDVENSGKLGANIGNISAGVEKSLTTEENREVKRQYVANFQRVVNETQPARINEMTAILGTEVLDSDAHYTYVLIDDLDKDWVDNSLSSLLIQCLFEAVAELQRIERLKILVALRTNIFYRVNSDVATRGGQEEKHRALSLDVEWNRADLIALLDLRVKSAGTKSGIDSMTGLRQILPTKSKKHGSAVDYLLDRKLMKPRDAIQYLNECVRAATGQYTIAWDNIIGCERKYSTERIEALRDEWRDPYVDLDKAIRLFAGCRSVLGREELAKVLDEIALLSADRKFKGTPWLTKLSENLLWGESVDWCDKYGQLVWLLYTVGFLGIKRSAGAVAEFSYQGGSRYRTIVDLADGHAFEIHPAFRAGLGIT